MGLTDTDTDCPNDYPPHVTENGAGQTGSAQSEARVELVHPLYLDVPMLTSFVASIEGGVAYESEVLRRLTAGTVVDRERAARLGISAISSLVGLGVSGSRSEEEKAEEQEEVKLLRTHTAASLFVLLRDALTRSQEITVLSGPADLDRVVEGQLIEFQGAFLGNPLEEALAWVDRALPFVSLAQAGAFSALDQSAGSSEGSEMPATTGTVASSGSKQTRQAKQKQRPRPAPVPDQNPAAQALASLPPELQAVVMLLGTLQLDLQNAAVLDVVLRGSTGLHAVLTLSRDYLQARDLQLLRGARPTVLGKVTAIATDRPMNLVRRSAFGMMGGDEMIVEAFEGIREISVLAAETPEPLIKPPCMQILPLAVFV